MQGEDLEYLAEANVAVLDYMCSFHLWMQGEDLEYLAEANVAVLDYIWSFDLWMQGEDLEYLAEPNVVVLSEELVIQNISLHQATHPTEGYLFRYWTSALPRFEGYTFVCKEVNIKYSAWCIQKKTL